VESMRKAAKDPKNYLEMRYFPDLKRENIPTYIVQRESQWHKADAVLRYCLGRRWQIADPDDEVLSAARRAYLRYPDEYDQILGDFIPAEFHKEARIEVAELWFDRGDLRGKSEDVCGDACGRYEQRHHHYLINVGRGFLGILEQFAQEEDESGVRIYAFPLG